MQVSAWSNVVCRSSAYLVRIMPRVMLYTRPLKKFANPRVVLSTQGLYYLFIHHMSVFLRPLSLASSVDKHAWWCYSECWQSVLEILYSCKPCRNIILSALGGWNDVVMTLWSSYSFSPTNTSTCKTFDLGVLSFGGL